MLTLVQPARRGRVVVSLVFAVLAGSASAEPMVLAAADQLMQLSLEQLLNVPVVSASKFRQSSDRAPASVTVLTAEDVRSFGWRTLADALASVRGFYITSDRVYKYAGVRGFSPPGDYNNRLLVMVDGYRLNDNVYDSGPIGSEFPLGMDLVERIEIVRGPGSSLYGGNALFGVINVITRSGAGMAGAEAALALGRFGDVRGRASWGKKLDNGADLLLSASRQRAPGGDVQFNDMLATNDGLASGADGDRNGSVFAKFSLDGLSLQAGWSRRDKGNPTGATGSVFNDPATALADEMAFLDGRYRHIFQGGGELEGRLFTGSYGYTANWLYPGVNPGDPNYINVDVARGRWWGGELKWLQTWQAHHLTAGVEYQDNRRQDQANYDESGTYYLDERHASRRWGIYLQDDYRVNERLSLTAGVRYDSMSGFPGTFSPRLAALLNLSPDTIVKVLYGSAFRAPNNYEMYYGYFSAGRNFQLANTQLQPERIRTLETTLDHYLTRSWRLTAAAYLYRMERQVVQIAVPDPASPGDTSLQYVNQDDISGRGLEFGVDGQYPNGARVRASLGFMDATDALGQRLDNSPRQLAKLNLAWPVAESWRLGLEGQAVGERISSGNRVGGYGMVNATLSRHARDGWEWSASVYNLFDRRVQDPAAADPYVPGRFSMPADGLSWRLKALYRF